MTRHSTKREFAVAATPLIAAPIVRSSRQEVALPKFLIVTAARGAVLGTLFAAVMLATNTLGLFTLLLAQPAPLTAALVFFLVCSMKFIPAVLAASLVLAARSK